MIKVIYHIADLHIRLFKRHLEYQTVLDELYENILNDIKKRKLTKEEVRIAIAGDMVHSKNQMTPELVSFVIRMLNDCTNICKTVIILGNHDFLANNLDRMDSIKIQVVMKTIMLCGVSSPKSQGQTDPKLKNRKNNFQIKNTLGYTTIQ